VNGINYLVADFSQTCGSTEWNRYLPLAIAAVVVYPFGVPALLFMALYSVRKRHQDPLVKISLGTGIKSINPPDTQARA
jgi:hypothetical protein